MHHAGGELPDSRQLFALHDLALDSPRVRHIFADGDDMTDLVAIKAHGNLCQPERSWLSAEGDIELGLLHFPGLEHPVEFRPKLLGRLTGDGALSIEGRKKDLLKTSYGKYVRASRIESISVSGWRLQIAEPPGRVVGCSMRCG